MRIPRWCMSRWNDDHREVRDIVRSDLGHGKHTLATRRGPLDVERLVETSRFLQCLDDGREGSAEFHDRNCVGVAEPSNQIGLGHRAGKHREDLFALDEGSVQCCRRRRNGGDTGDDLSLELLREPLVHVHERAVEEGSPAASSATVRPACRCPARRSAASA